MGLEGRECGGDRHGQEALFVYVALWQGIRRACQGVIGVLQIPQALVTEGPVCWAYNGGLVAKN